MISGEYLDLVLCQENPLADAYLRRALNICLSRFRASMLFRAATVVLTGSLARGEASVVVNGETLHSLSDMEFLVSLETSQSYETLIRELAHLEKGANEAITAAGIQCKAEFTYALHRYYSNARPSIFAYELRTHGKLVQGTEKLLELMPAFPAEDIPRIDAFYLLCNRMIEQLELFRVFLLGKDNSFEQEFRYALLKGYVDLATSVLIFCRLFAPSYRGRRDLFCHSKLTATIGISGIERLQERVDYWTQIKLNPTADSFRYLPDESPLEEWKELAVMVSSVWQWELAQLTGKMFDNFIRMKRQFIHLGSFQNITRNKIKFLLTALRRKELNPSIFSYLAGDPRHLLYAEAGALYIQLAQETDSTPLSATLSRRIKNIDRIWKDYFRNV